VKRSGGNIVGIGVMVDRSPEKVDFGIPFFSCHRAEVVTYPPEQCPLCAKGIPLVKPGSPSQVKDKQSG
jgi:orotate phosphoribosyltransferase